MFSLFGGPYSFTVVCHLESFSTLLTKLVCAYYDGDSYWICIYNIHICMYANVSYILWWDIYIYTLCISVHHGFLEFGFTSLRQRIDIFSSIRQLSLMDHPQPSRETQGHEGFSTPHRTNQCIPRFSDGFSWNVHFETPAVAMVQQGNFRCKSLIAEWDLSSNS